MEGVAARVWPDEHVQLGPQLPSVTNYVALLQVGARSLVAKYSLLGTSLVSVVRGLRGDWPEVESRQRDYVADPRALLAGEYAASRDSIITRSHRTIEFARKPIQVSDDDRGAVCAVDLAEHVAYHALGDRTGVTLTAVDSLGLCLA
ncbi:MAG: hypothetical protein ACREX8_03345, partial [Gammaproteobacteria bacterium]